MSIFDPSTFLEATLTEPTTKRPPLPIGDYTAVIKAIDPKSGEKDGRAWARFDITLSLEVPAHVQTDLGLSNSTLDLKHTVFLDITPQGGLDNGPGKNRQIGFYRDALDMNKTGDVFSPKNMIGKPLLAKVSHDLKGDAVYEKISGVTKLL